LGHQDAGICPQRPSVKGRGSGFRTKLIVHPALQNLGAHQIGEQRPSNERSPRPTDCFPRSRRTQPDRRFSLLRAMPILRPPRPASHGWQRGCPFFLPWADSSFQLLRPPAVARRHPSPRKVRRRTNFARSFFEATLASDNTLARRAVTRFRRNHTGEVLRNLRPICLSRCAQRVRSGSMGRGPHLPTITNSSAPSDSSEGVRGVTSPFGAPSQKRVSSWADSIVGRPRLSHADGPAASSESPGNLRPRARRRPITSLKSVGQSRNILPLKADPYAFRFPELRPMPAPSSRVSTP